MRCRVCKGKSIKSGQLYRCTKCPAAFWHRRVLRRDLTDENCFVATLAEAKVPAFSKKIANHHYVYVISLDRPAGSLYVGMTGLHPFERFLNHLRGYKAAGRVRRFGRAMNYFEGPMCWKDAVAREGNLADELREAGNKVYGGH